VDSDKIRKRGQEIVKKMAREAKFLKENKKLIEDLYAIIESKNTMPDAYKKMPGFWKDRNEMMAVAIAKYVSEVILHRY
jgi:uncharacterized protein YihD (DUF1040 family)